MQNISVMIKPASGSCNMSCDYCFYKDEQQSRNVENYGLMSELTLKNTIRKMVLHSKNSCTIIFQGGEPTLAGLAFFEKAVEYANRYAENRVKVNFSLQTNGYSINEDWCSFFKKNNFLVGVSIDGTSDLHNQHRHTINGGDTYDTIVSTTKLMDIFGVDYNILTVVNGTNASHAKKIYRNYQSNGWKWQQYISLIEPINNDYGYTRYSLTSSQYANFLIELFNCWYKDVLRKRQPYIRQFENYIGILFGLNPESCDMLGCCSTQYAVESDGSVFPCDFYMLDQYKLGNVNDTIIEHLDKKRDELKFIDRSLKRPEKCSGCEYLLLCRNGCQRNRDEYNLNYFCSAYKQFFSVCLPKMKQII